MSFQKSLARGRVGESLIARWLMARGHSVLPVYEIEEAHGKGPQMFSAEGQFVAPDMLVFTAGRQVFIEAKHKSVFTWHRITGRWTTGIDLRHYEDYMRVSKRTRLPVWLMFMHSESAPSKRDVEAGCPARCPTGLYGGELLFLASVENHRSKPYNPNREGYVGHGSSGMVYWAESTLRKFASVDEVMKCNRTLEMIE